MHILSHKCVKDIFVAGIRIKCALLAHQLLLLGASHVLVVLAGPLVGVRQVHLHLHLHFRCSYIKMRSSRLCRKRLQNSIYYARFMAKSCPVPTHTHARTRIPTTCPLDDRQHPSQAQRIRLYGSQPSSARFRADFHACYTLYLALALSLSLSLSLSVCLPHSLRLAL